ncbi:ABC transporter ATP-binding protein [Streptomyces marokkonensis]|uniref:ABC transporter ATP-binding protein n=1 Tax=Streptomyces marokkonensis TaxID=324855 RepID=UPI0011F1B0AF|nr:ABC transporter ATP-binding protein [Streptomyces marokkonensis]
MTVSQAAGAERRLRLGDMAASARTAAAFAWQAAPWHTVVLVVTTTAGAGVPVVMAWLTGALLNRLVGAEESALLGLACGLAGLGLMAALLPPLSTYAGNQLGRRANLRLVDRLYRVINSLPGLARMEDPSFQDRLRMAQAAGGQATGGIVQSLLLIAASVLTTAGFVGTLYVVSPFFTIVVLASCAPAFVAELRLSRRRALGDWRVSSTRRREWFYESLMTSPHALQEIQLFEAGDFLRGRMLAERRTADAERRAVDRQELKVQGGLALLGSLIGGAGLVWAALAARRGQLSVGDVSIFIAGVAGVQAALSQLMRALAHTHHLLLLMRHYLAVIEIADRAPPLPVDGGPAGLPALRRGIELRDVWFRYDESHPWVLRGVDLFIPAGRSVALVGHNGAGKSTLVKLLCRFYEPTRGSILWDGVDIRRIPVKELRRRLGAVFQPYMEYDLTAAENIAIGDTRALDDRPRLKGAARRAGIDGVISALPRGYDTMLSKTLTRADDTSAGALLSGGQWQRLALARALLRERPDLLILDEPSSGLDAEAEHDIHLRLARYRAGRTSLLISHRLAAVRDADRIVVLHDGRIEEEGRHQDLVDAKGTYARLFTLQAKGYQHRD